MNSRGVATAIAILTLLSLTLSLGQLSNVELEKRAAKGDINAAFELSNRLPNSEQNILRLLDSKNKVVRDQTVRGKTFLLTPVLQEAFYGFAIDPTQDWVSRKHAIESVAFGPKNFLKRMIKIYNSKPLHLKRIGAYGVSRYDFWKGAGSDPLAAKYMKKLRSDPDKRIRGMVGG